MVEGILLIDEKVDELLFNSNVPMSQLLGLSLGSLVSSLQLGGLLVERCLLGISHLLPALANLLGDISDLSLLEPVSLHDSFTILAGVDHESR